MIHSHRIISVFFVICSKPCLDIMCIEGAARVKAGDRSSGRGPRATASARALCGVGSSRHCCNAEMYTWLMLAPAKFLLRYLAESLPTPSPALAWHRFSVVMCDRHVASRPGDCALSSLYCGAIYESEILNANLAAETWPYGQGVPDRPEILRVENALKVPPLAASQRSAALLHGHFIPSRLDGHDAPTGPMETRLYCHWTFTRPIGTKFGILPPAAPGLLNCR